MCHAGRGDLLTEPWRTAAPLGAYLRRARAAGIDRTIVLPASHTDYGVANRELARLVAAHRPRLIGFAGIHATRDAGRIHAMVGQAVRRYGFRGLKVHGDEAQPTREVCAAARAFRLPMLVDVGGQAWHVEMFAPEYRDVNFIIAHLGSFADDFRAMQQVVDQLVRHPNVFADTSGVRRFDYIVRLGRTMAAPRRRDHQDPAARPWAAGRGDGLGRQRPTAAAQQPSPGGPGSSGAETHGRTDVGNASLNENSNSSVQLFMNARCGFSYD